MVVASNYLPAERMERTTAHSRAPSKSAFSRPLVPTLFTLGIIGAGIIGFGLFLAMRTPTATESLDVGEALSDTVIVYRNEFGIPHIIARNDDDAFFSLGYVHAYDRLWQMDLLRRIARGELSEIYGDAFLPVDKFFRTIGLGYTADSIIFPAISPESKRILRAYSSGINTFIQHHQRSLPFEFGALNYLPSIWTESDCIAIGRLMAFDLSMSSWVDLVLGEVAEHYGIERALKLLPTQGDSLSIPSTVSSRIATPTRAYKVEFRKIGDIVKPIIQYHLSVRERAGITSLNGGSNSWAVGRRDNQRDAVLANDPHLVLALPARWHQVHLTSPSYNVIGATVPGLPMILIGRNPAIAWGVTNVMLDDCDYFLEMQDSTHTNSVTIGGRPVKMNVRFDTIPIRGNRKHVIAIWSIDNRPIISGVHPTAHYDTLIRFPKLLHQQALSSRYIISFAWTGYQPSDEIRAILNVMRSHSWRQFVSALKSWNTPALNFTYADVAGNVGIQPAGFVPIRTVGHPNLPRLGWDTSYAWKQIFKGVLPAVFNPSDNFVLSANNRITDSMPIFLSHLWEPRSRAQRIAELLAMYSHYTERDAQFMQLDQISPYAKTLSGVVLPILQHTQLDSIEALVLKMLSTWDYSMLSTSPSAAIYSVFLERLIRNTFCMYLQEDEYHRYAFVASLPLRRVIECLYNPSSWFDNDSLRATHLRNAIIIQSYRQAIKTIVSIAGTNVNKWKWGQIHPLILEHPLSAIGAYRGLLSRTLLNMGGDATTIANTLWRLHKPFKVAVGPSLRFVTRLRDTIAYSIIPGGISGNPFSSNFTDQLTLWENGGLLVIPLSPYPQQSWKQTTILKPTIPETR